MAIVAPVVDGVLQDTSASGTTASSTSSADNSSLDKEAFLQLLVTQMQYQDPLEPTSNTEYISQLATFSSLEAMQNLQSTSSNSMAASLVGENVIMKTTSSTTGSTSYVSGVVDYVVYEEGKAYLSINDTLYSIDDLDTVVSDEYLDAYDAATTVSTTIKALPDDDKVTLDDEKAITAARTAYDGLSTYAKEFVSSSTLTILTAAETKLKALKAEQTTATA